jgi:hypothetical protein
MLVLLYAFMLMAVDVGTKGGKRTFAARAKVSRQIDESGH